MSGASQVLCVSIKTIIETTTGPSERINNAVHRLMRAIHCAEYDQWSRMSRCLKLV